jgi:hypothetical protein
MELKKQFSRFDQNFTLPPAEDLVIHCLHPVLQAEDLRWLGAAPKTVAFRDGGTEWLVRWIKEPAPGVEEEVVFDMEIALRFVDERLVEARIPKRHLAYISKDLVLNMLRSTGAAKVDQNNRKADAQIETPAAASLPTLNTIKSMMGEPTSRQSSPGQLVYFYRYRLDIINSSSKPIEVAFEFDPETGALLKFTARLPRGTLSYEFKPASGG